MSRELDIEVAVKVMGYSRDKDARLIRVLVNHPSVPEGTTISDGPKPYTTDASADYQVLARVRQKWTLDQLFAFERALNLAWDSRTKDDAPHLLHYEPGDYSRAALAALTPAAGREGG